MIDIHTIWLGNKPSLLSQVCMNDWQKQGYSFRLWSEKDHQVKLGLLSVNLQNDVIS